MNTTTRWIIVILVILLVALIMAISLGLFNTGVDKNDFEKISQKLEQTENSYLALQKAKRADSLSVTNQLLTATYQLNECINKDSLAKFRADSLALAKKQQKKGSELAYLQSRVRSLEDKIANQPTYTAPSPTYTPTPSGNYQTNYPEVSPPTKSTGKIIEFCLLYDNNDRWHMPQYAIDQNWVPKFGIKENDAKTGHNFYVMDPGELVDEPTGLSGVTRDGRFFVAAEFLIEFSPVTGSFEVYIKNAFTGWNTARKMRLEGNYYVWKP